MTPPEIVTAIKDVVVALASICAAVVALRGVSTWQREMRGKTAFEIAQKLARATYKARDELQQVRTPLIHGFEFPEGYNPNESDPRQRGQGLAHVYTNRTKTLTEAVQNFDAAALEAEALWGADARTKCDELRKCVGTLFIAIEALIEDAHAAGLHFDGDKEFGRMIRTQVHASPGAKDNKLSNQIDESVSDIESFLVPHLRR